jgi:transposase InsO family protein
LRQVERAAEKAAHQAWRASRQALFSEQTQVKAMPPPVPAWIAILVLIDNCTRRCLALVSFAAGVHLTAESLVAALSSLLPAGLQFVISDNGLLFCSKSFAALADTAHFLHVRIAPYRPRTNGIAERFGRTLKDWLQDHAWSGPADMPALLAQMQQAYDDRPHQGRELHGLSPNEYQRRLRLGATC